MPHRPTSTSPLYPVDGHRSTRSASWAWRPLLVIAMIAGTSAFAEESRTPTDFDVPVSAHIECDSATGVEVKGLDDVRTIEDILKLRERLAAKELSQEDLSSWRFLDDLGIERVPRERSAPRLSTIDGPIVSESEMIPSWRRDVIDFDANRYARRSSRGERMWRHVVVPASQVWIDLGGRSGPTKVGHAVTAKGEGSRREDAAGERRVKIGMILGNPTRGPDEKWEVVRSDASGTLFRKTLFIEGPAPPLNSIAETYVLADVAAEEVRCEALIKDGRPVHFRLHGQRLPQEDSHARRVVPQVTLVFQQEQWHWAMNAYYVQRVEFDPALSPDLFSYRLEQGDEYRVKLGSDVRSTTAGDAGFDVPATTPEEAWERVSAGAKGP